eukprot:NP_492664.1 Uncharacterized protein CELE_B0379.6 [Caenorhabditis elegans]
MGLKNDTVSEKKMKRNKKKDDDEDENKDGEMKTKEEKEQNNRGGVYLGLWRQKRAHLMKGGRRLTRNCVGCGGSRAPETTIDDARTENATRDVTSDVLQFGCSLLRVIEEEEEEPVETRRTIEEDGLKQKGWSH